MGKSSGVRGCTQNYTFGIYKEMLMPLRRWRPSFENSTGDLYFASPSAGFALRYDIDEDSWCHCGLYPPYNAYT